MADGHVSRSKMYFLDPVRLGARGSSVVFHLRANKAAVSLSKPSLQSKRSFSVNSTVFESASNLTISQVVYPVNIATGAARIAILSPAFHASRLSRVALKVGDCSKHKNSSAQQDDHFELCHPFEMSQKINVTSSYRVELTVSVHDVSIKDNSAVSLTMSTVGCFTRAELDFQLFAYGMRIKFHF